MCISTHARLRHAHERSDTVKSRATCELVRCMLRGLLRAPTRWTLLCCKLSPPDTRMHAMVENQRCSAPQRGQHAALLPGGQLRRGREALGRPGKRGAHVAALGVHLADAPQQLQRCLITAAAACNIGGNNTTTQVCSYMRATFSQTLHTCTSVCTDPHCSAAAPVLTGGCAQRASGCVSASQVEIGRK